MLHALKCKCVTAERSVFMSAHAPRTSVLAPRRFLTYGSNARGAGSRGWVFFFFPLMEIWGGGGHEESRVICSCLFITFIKG